MKRILITFTVSIIFLILLQAMETESLVSNDQQQSNQNNNDDNSNNKDTNGNNYNIYSNKNTNNHGSGLFKPKAAINVVDARVSNGFVECTR